MKELQAQFNRSSKELSFSLPNNNKELSFLNSQEYLINTDMGTNDDFALFQLENDSPRYLLLFSWNKSYRYCGVSMFTIEDDYGYEAFSTCDEHQIFLQYDWQLEEHTINIDDEDSIIDSLSDTARHCFF